MSDRAPAASPPEFRSRAGEAAQRRLKVHRRTVRLDGAADTLLAPRPETSARLATYDAADTWQFFADVEGAIVLAQLLWAMAFQRRPHTLAVLDESFLVPNPVDGESSLPIVVVNTELGPLAPPAAAELRALLPLATPAEGTITLQTRGLELALGDPAGFYARDRSTNARWGRRQRRPWVHAMDGLVVLAAPPLVLRTWAVDVSILATRSPDSPKAGGPDEGDGVLLLEHVASGTTGEARPGRPLEPGSETPSPPHRPLMP